MNLRPSTRIFGCSRPNTPNQNTPNPIGKARKTTRPSSRTTSRDSKKGVDGSQNDIRKFCTPVPRFSLLAQANRAPRGPESTRPTPTASGTSSVRTNSFCAQLNLNKSKYAKEYMDLHPSQIQILQEQPCWGVNSSLRNHRFNVFSGKGEGEKPRAAIRVSKALNAAELVEHRSKDRSVCLIKCNNYSIIIASQYCDIKKPPIDEGLERLVNYCYKRNLPLLLGIDSNSHSLIWGPDSNPRGLAFEDFISRNKLHILNDGKKPTFIQGDRKTYIDITLLNSAAMDKGVGREWQVHDEKPNSDHRTITFRMDAESRSKKEVRDMQKIDWPEFRKDVENELTKNHYPDDKPKMLVEAINYSLDKNAPKKVISDKFKPRWWNETLESKRLQIKRLSSKRYRCHTEELKLQTLNKEFKKDTKRAKKESFEKFCTKPESAKEISGLLKSLNTTDNTPSIIKGADGECPTSLEVSHENLLKHHFPNYTSIKPVAPPPGTNEGG